MRNHKRFVKPSGKKVTKHIAAICRNVQADILNGTSIIHVRRFCGGGCEFLTQDGERHSIEGTWDLIIAHPPCTYLTVSGNSWFNLDKWCTKAAARWKDRVSGIDFFMDFVVCNAKKVAIENPIGVMSNVYRKPDQIIQPYEYGHPYTKQTCLWLKGLPLLHPTEILEKPETGWVNQCFTPDGRYGGFKNFNGSKERSKTFPGIARAMADQWG